MGKKRVKKKKNSSTPKTSEVKNLEDSFSLAIQYHQAGHIDRAIQIYQRILGSYPENHAVLNLFGLALFTKGQLDKALSFLSKASSISPGTAKYHYDLGVVLQNSGKDEEAIGHYRETLALEPKNKAAWENMGVALFDCGYNQEAVSAFKNALELNPDSVLALTNLSTLCCWQGRHQQALDLLNTALAVDPAHISARMKRAEIFLSLGNFSRGWNEYAWRFAGSGRPGQDPVRFVPLPKWNGQSLSGGTLLVHTEQGIGDEVMFASCLPDLLEQGVDCCFLCDPRMVKIFKRSFPELDVLPNISAQWGLMSESLKADVRLPLGDLPGLFRASSRDFSQQKGYLKADGALVEHWSQRLSHLGSGLKIGISWRGGRQKYSQRARSIPLELFSPLLSLQGISFVNLQYGDCKEDLSTLPESLQTKIISFPEIDPLVDLENFFAVISTLDLVISVDNSTVHFAGALGIQTWLLLPSLGDWRWPVGGTDSRWYPSVRLIRQQYEERGDWAPVIDCAVKMITGLTAKNIECANVADDLSEKQVVTILPSGQSGMRKALLLNDTSFWYHWGCTGTSLAIRNNLQKGGWTVRGVPIHYLRSLLPVPANYKHWNDELYESFRRVYGDLCESLEQTDVLVVNGEGSLHGNSALPINLLYLMHIAKTRFGKSVQVINHSCYPDNQSDPSGSQNEKLYQHIYSELDYVAVREPISRVLLEKLGVKVTQSFDCLPLFIKQFHNEIESQKTRQIVFSGSVAWNQSMIQAICQLVMDVAEDQQCYFLFGANAYPAGDDIAMIQKLQQVLPNKVQLLFAKSELEWLRTIASARLFISGRFHHSIAAACLKTPFIVMDSNTPKISGLMQTLELDCHVSCLSSQFSSHLLESAKELIADPVRGLMTEKNHQKILSLAENNFLNLV